MRLWLNTPITVPVGPFPSRRAAKLCWKAGRGPGEWDHIPAVSAPLCFCPQGSAAPGGTGQVRVLLSTPSTSWAPQPRLPAERFFDILHPGPIPSPGPRGAASFGPTRPRLRPDPGGSRLPAGPPSPSCRCANTKTRVELSDKTRSQAEQQLSS